MQGSAGGCWGCRDELIVKVNAQGAWLVSRKLVCYCRCTAPESEFRKAGMAPSKVKSASLGGESAVASREDFKARGTEHSFCLK